jgi:beta-aspartyl-dipeptidase (metallo-type)
MFKLLKNGNCYAPESIGNMDILLCYDKICRIEDNINIKDLWDVEIYDCSNKYICPGFIDQHLHITGGGGEEGPVSRIPEIGFSDIVSAGVTTIVGLLGVDGITRNIAGLLTKARALEAEGITTFIYTGCYGSPIATLTGKAITDISLIDKIIGIGEIAISDYRSSHLTVQDLKQLAYEAKVGGLLGAKAGIMHIHLGEGKEGLSPLKMLLEDSNFPINMFVPTHINRKKELFLEGIEYHKMGGNIDLTAGENGKVGYSVPEAVELLVKTGSNLDRVTVSSDGNGSIPTRDGSANGVGKVMQLFEDIKSCISEKNIKMEIALKIVTLNVAKILNLYPQKGVIMANADADIIVLNKNLSLDKVLVKGELVLDKGMLLKNGRFEKK